jgi:hypothetical protein
LIDVQPCSSRLPGVLFASGKRLRKGAQSASSFFSGVGVHDSLYRQIGKEEHRLIKFTPALWLEPFSRPNFFLGDSV